MRLGSKIGIVFQLLDDLSELTEQLSQHEKEVNPFLKFEAESFATLAQGITLIKDHEGAQISSVLGDYFLKMKSIITNDLESSNSKVSQQLAQGKALEKVREICSLL
jgi:geranylgeranyl pyrophosphate synthase